ncbi:hypothetical protein M378DRAFT_173211 [Amanita muscaria Koide BX008]|uniref:Uncharacterized protein n=1 Tax=Amanita muscaria (strain Koide BX008) TaxID=946122 RepID=A0A0C2RZQ9_AMAMK|nr:hypothetical protein M378DRAFT_173211 [Amanita muscaria Koide BX008]
MAISTSVAGTACEDFSNRAGSQDLMAFRTVSAGGAVEAFISSEFAHYHAECTLVSRRCNQV